MNQKSRIFWRGFFSLPSTKMGWWAFALSAAFSILMFINSAVFARLPEADWQPVILPFYGIGMMLCGLASGTVAVIAIVWRDERSLLTWLSMLTGLFVLVFLLGEFLFPH